MKIACISDLHGHLPEVGECEMLLLAGDICPDGTAAEQMFWLNSRCREWVTSLRRRGIQVVAVAGNHDGIFADHPHLVPWLPWIYLQDSSTDVDDDTFLTRHRMVPAHLPFKIWGTPWVLPYGKWSFMQPEPFLAERFAAIPDDTDIIITHGPPHGVADSPAWRITANNEQIWPITHHEGSRSMLDVIKRIKPKLVVCGHIHEGRGIHRLNETIIVNGASWNHLTDEWYGPLYVHL